MKKLITLLLAVAGMVSTASATDYIVSGNPHIVNGNHQTEVWWWQDDDNLLKETSSSGIYTLVVEGCNLTANTEYGFKIKVNENAWNDETTFPSQEYRVTVPYTATYTLIYYVDLNNKGIRVIATPMLRWNYGGEGSGNWNWLYDSSSFFEKKGDFEWTFDVPYNKFTGDFSFRIYSGVFQKSAYPDGQDVALTVGGASLTSAFFNTAESTDYSWKITKPSCTFEKAVITAVYNPFANSDGTWTVSANAYISKTVSATYDYATFGTTVPVDLSGVSAKGVTAYSVTADAATNKVYKVAKSDVLAANKGVLLENLTNEDVTLSIPVSASAAGTESNDLVAFTGSGNLTQPTSGNETYYILTDNDGESVGFYKVNTKDGNVMGANTAYLTVTGLNARSFLWFDDASGISDTAREATSNDRYYNLNGQVVAQPTKGLYIVNGKKVIMK